MSAILETLTEPLSALRPSRYMLLRMDADVKVDCGLTLDDVRIGEVEPIESVEREYEADYIRESLELENEYRRIADDEFGLFGEEL